MHCTTVKKGLNTFHGLLKLVFKFNKFITDYLFPNKIRVGLPFEDWSVTWNTSGFVRVSADLQSRICSSAILHVPNRSNYWCSRMLGIIAQLAVFLQNTFFSLGYAGVWSESNLRTFRINLLPQSSGNTDYPDLHLFVVFLRHPKQMPD